MLVLWVFSICLIEGTNLHDLMRADLNQSLGLIRALVIGIDLQQLANLVLLVLQ